MKLKDIVISHSISSNKIYFGIFNKIKDRFIDRKDCTNEALIAVRDYLLQTKDREGLNAYLWKIPNGNYVILSVRTGKINED